MLDREKLVTKLGNGIHSAVCVIDEPSHTGLRADLNAANTKLLHVEAVRLVFEIPLLFKRESEFAKELYKELIILVCEASAS